MIRILLHKKHSYSRKLLIKKEINYIYPSDVAEIIQSGSFFENYDLNKDGYVNKVDYDLAYNNFYKKYRNCNIVELAKCRKKVGTHDTNFDLDSDGTVTTADVLIMQKWLIEGKKNAEM